MAAATLTAARPRTRVRASLPALLAGFVVADLAISVVSLSVSGAHLPLWPAVQAAFGAHNPYSTVVTQSVLPRVLLCWLAGAALGVSGGVIQGLIPMTSGEASGLRITPWMTPPDTPRAAPASQHSSTRGSTLCVTTVL